MWKQDFENGSLKKRGDGGEKRNICLSDQHGGRNFRRFLIVVYIVKMTYKFPTPIKCKKDMGRIL